MDKNVWFFLFNMDSSLYRFKTVFYYIIVVLIFIKKLVSPFRFSVKIHFDMVSRRIFLPEVHGGTNLRMGIEIGNEQNSTNRTNRKDKDTPDNLWCINKCNGVKRSIELEHIERIAAAPRILKSTTNRNHSCKWTK